MFECVTIHEELINLPVEQVWDSQTDLDYYKSKNVEYFPPEGGLVSGSVGKYKFQSDDNFYPILFTEVKKHERIVAVFDTFLIKCVIVNEFQKICPHSVYVIQKSIIKSWLLPIFKKSLLKECSIESHKYFDYLNSLEPKVYPLE